MIVAFFFAGFTSALEDSAEGSRSGPQASLRSDEGVEDRQGLGPGVLPQRTFYDALGDWLIPNVERIMDGR